mgnify:FL=1
MKLSDKISLGTRFIVSIAINNEYGAPCGFTSIIEIACAASGVNFIRLEHGGFFSEIDDGMP